MIKLQGKLPRQIYIAVSGGVDSMVAIDFLKRNHDVRVLHFHHGTGHADKARHFVKQYCKSNRLEMHSDQISGTLPLGRSREDYWREHRYNFLSRFTDHPVITAHHLDDCVETWLFSSLHGTGKIVPYRRNYVIRPFRLNRKRDLQLWADLKGVPYIEDDSNSDLCYNRNYIRHEMMPHVLRVNPGIYKTIAKKVKEDERQD
jgi:tRNA(Ile)-lysidine synthase